jgi:hypothetical protein
MNAAAPRSLRHVGASACALAMVLAAGAGALADRAGLRVLEVDAPRDALAAAPRTVVELVAHNLPVAIWPLALVALGWPALPGARRVGDALVAGQLLGHGALVGSALTQHPGLWRYLPHLPLEWLALALPVAVWASARADRHVGAVAVGLVALRVGVLLGLAAIVESYLVPLP